MPRKQAIQRPGLLSPRSEPAQQREDALGLTGLVCPCCWVVFPAEHDGLCGFAWNSRFSRSAPEPPAPESKVYTTDQ